MSSVVIRINILKLFVVEMLHFVKKRFSECLLFLKLPRCSKLLIYNYIIKIDFAIISIINFVFLCILTNKVIKILLQPEDLSFKTV